MTLPREDLASVCLPLPAGCTTEQSLLSVAFLGGFAGYIVSQFPFVFLPTFMLALGGGGFLAYLATTRK